MPSLKVAVLKNSASKAEGEEAVSRRGEKERDLDWAIAGIVGIVVVTILAVFYH